jgi:elongation factor Ts
MAITPQMVMALRAKTGLPMMECKLALQEAEGDETKAIEILRKKGLSQISKRAEREASEGRVACFVDPQSGRGGIVELRCETAPVAKTPDFIGLANLIAKQAARMTDPTPESILDQPSPDQPSRKLRDVMTEVVNRIRENIQIARVGSLSGHVSHYLHHNGQVGVLVELSAECPTQVGLDVCMHVAAMRPLCARREEVDPALIEQERRIAAEQVKGKPANMMDKIVSGKLNRWYGEMVLLEQPFVKDDKKSVGQYLLGAVPGLTVKRYLRYEVGQS